MKNIRISIFTFIALSVLTFSLSAQKKAEPVANDSATVALFNA